MEIRVLGPVEVDVVGRPLELRGPKQRAVLSLLALNANATVSVDRLIEGLWGEQEQPASAAKMVQLYVSQLRKLLGEGGGAEIVTRGRGYELRIDPEAVDAARFERLLAEASRTDRNGGAGEAARAALALWRGPPLADLLDEPFAPAEARRLEELHLAALELAIESDLETGRHHELIGRLESLVAEHPLSERLHGLRMLALYRAGRQADALDAYRTARATLVEEIGIEPGPELRRLHEAILRQDPALERTVPDADWARRETAERVDEGAGRAAARRGELRDIEAALASDIADLHAVTERTELRSESAPQPGDEHAVPVCPFKGLASFEVSDADYFFGRERLVAEVVARLVGATLLGVVGPSGSGKSSTLRAGLLPALAGGVLPGSESWRQVLLRPGEHPLADLERALARLEPEGRLLLAVDQFEELFTACREQEERAEYMDALADAAQRADGRVVVVLALRTDYYGACAAHPRLARLLGESHVLVGPMQPDELTLAIEGPARKASLLVEPELVSRLVEDVAGQAGGLPLLSTALLELWQHREGRRIRLAAYERTGGVERAVARLAERAYGTLTEDEQRVARRILLRLSGSGEGDAVVRRRIALDELEVDRDERAARVLEVLTDNRLVTVGEGTAEVAHEALLREWPRLRGWLEEDAEGRRLHRHITLAARDWDTGRRDPGELYRGARLAAALDWAAGRWEELNRLEGSFLEDSRLASARETERSRQVSRRLGALLAAAVAALAVAIAAGLLALDQRGDARATALSADAQRVGAEALTEDRIDRALLLARAGVDLDDSVVTRGNLLAVLLRSPRAAIGVLGGTADAEIFGLAVSPDGRLLALGDGAGTVTMYDAANRRRLGEYQLGGRPGGGLVQNLEFSPDGRTLAVTGQDPVNEPPGALVDLIDSRTLERRVRAVLPPFPEPSEFVIASAAFLPDGRNLVVIQTHGAIADGPASVLRRVDGQTGEVGRRSLRVGRQGSLDLFPTTDRRHVFVTSARDDETFEIDAESLRVVRRHPAGGFVGAVGPDGRAFALGSEDGRVRLLDLRSGEVRRFSGRHEAGLLNMTFTPDGRSLVSSDANGGVITWDVADGAISEELSAHRGRVWGLAVSPDGRTLYSSADDARTILWDLAGDRRLVRPFSVGRPFEEDLATPRGIAVSPDGRTLALTHSDGAVDLFDTGTLQRRRSLRAMRGFAAAVDFSPDGRLLAVAGERGRVTLWDALTLAPAGELRGLRANVQAVAFSPDGELLAAAEVDTERPRLHVWSVRRGTVTLRSDTQATSLAFSPDGKLIAAAALDRGTEIRDARSARLVKRLPTEGLSRSVAFSRDGSLLAVGQFDGDGHLYSTESWEPVGRRLEGHTQRITFADFSPDGRTLATASADGAVALWDVESQKPVGSPLTVEPDTFASVTLSPDGSRLFAVSTRGDGIRLATAPEAWKRHACLVAGRELTESEWNDALPGRSYRAICGG
jgi:WD40 repeat protein/DNA-binding SARP family transcriptional activator